MRYKTLVFRPGFGSDFGGTQPNFAVLDFIYVNGYGVLMLGEIPDLYYGDTTLDFMARAWRGRRDIDGKDLGERILTECDMVDIELRVR